LRLRGYTGSSLERCRNEWPVAKPYGDNPSFSDDRRADRGRDYVVPAPLEVVFAVSSKFGSGMRTFVTALVAFGSLALFYGCSARPSTTGVTSSSPPQPNTTDIVSVDREAGTFVALVRREHTTDRIVAKCGVQCPSPGRNVAGFWSLPASQVSWVVVSETETEGLQSH
jgi:hypothetical protein